MNIKEYLGCLGFGAICGFFIALIISLIYSCFCPINPIGFLIYPIIGAIAMDVMFSIFYAIDPP